MNHYIINFKVTIDGNEIKTGITGITSHHTDYKPEIVKRSIEAHFRKKTPHANSISVVLTDHQLVSGEDYIRAAKDFLETK